MAKQYKTLGDDIWKNKVEKIVSPPLAALILHRMVCAWLHVLARTAMQPATLSNVSKQQLPGWDHGYNQHFSLVSLYHLLPLEC